MLEDVLGQPLDQVCAGRETIVLTPSQQRKLFRGKRPEFIGSGTRACAYGVDGEVVKFTVHDQDAAAALALKSRPVRGVVRVLDVRPVTDFPGGPWAIRSKRVPPPSALAETVRTCAVASNLDGAFRARFLKKQRAPVPISRDMRACLLLRAPRAGVAPARAVAFAEELSRTQARLARATRIHWADTSSYGNISEEGGKPVLVDLGSAFVPGRYLLALGRRPELRGAEPVICLSKARRNFHIVTEALSIGLIVPFAAYFAIKGGMLSPLARAGFGSIALASLLVDGYLLTKWK
jgi:hypothetical protein